MYLTYGNYTHASGECAVQISRQPTRVEGSGYRNGYVETWLVKGFLQGANTAALVTSIASLEAAYAVDNATLTLYEDSGAIADQLDTNSTIGGVRVVGGISYPDDGQRNAEFATFRNYEIRLEATVPDRTVGLLAWTESVGYTGEGGHQFVILEPQTGEPIKQIVKRRTKQTATQQGRAIGQFGYPFAPYPIWPDHEKLEMRSIRRNSPKRSGPIGAPTFTEFEIEWSYTFESTGYLIGLPGLWLP